MASPTVTIRMLSKTAISPLERALGAGDLEPERPGPRHRNGAGTERVSSRANQITPRVANVNNS